MNGTGIGRSEARKLARRFASGTCAVKYEGAWYVADEEDFVAGGDVPAWTLAQVEEYLVENEALADADRRAVPWPAAVLHGVEPE